MIEWRKFLQRWAAQVAESSLGENSADDAQQKRSQRFKGASKREIEKLEERLGVSLPPSYREFLQTSNGWGRTTSFIGLLRSAKEVDWFRTENREWCEIYAQMDSPLPDADYFSYTPQNAAHYRASHLRSLLQISDVDDGVYLLNPAAVTPDGEWEAWFLANWVPGPRRYPSFLHLMVSEYSSFAELEGIDRDENVVPPLPEVSPEAPRTSVAPDDEEINRGTPTLEDCIAEMADTDPQVRKKAARTLEGLLQGRNFAERRPDLIEPATKLFYSSNDNSVRSMCVQLLTEIAEQGAAPGPLYDALLDSDPNVMLSGIFALEYFPDERALQPLCEFVDSRRNELYSLNAIGALKKMGNSAAVPTLSRILLKPSDYARDQMTGSAAQALAECGQAGFDVLVTAIEHEDPIIRLAALVGIDVSGHPNSSGYLDQAKEDPDPAVRDRASFRVGRKYR